MMPMLVPTTNVSLHQVVLIPMSFALTIIIALMILVTVLRVVFMPLLIAMIKIYALWTAVALSLVVNKLIKSLMIKTLVPLITVIKRLVTLHIPLLIVMITTLVP
jgi:hypothetical protein